MGETREQERPKRFEVVIESGGRALAEEEAQPVERAAVTLSPARAAAKARARRRNLILVVSAVALLASAILYAWLTNPSANIPSDAVARVNGQLIYERDIERRLNFLKFLDALYSRTSATAPNAASALEETIAEYMQLQDARRAGTTLTESDVDEDIATIAGSAGRTTPELEEMLGRYSLKMADLREYSASALLIKKYVQEKVLAGAKNETDAQNLYNDWLQSLINTSKIERFKAAGAGPAPRVGAEAPDFALKDVEGNEVKLSGLRGRPVMVNFWATWCPPCRDEIPEIVKMYREAGGGRDYEVLGVATQSDSSTIRAFAQEFGMQFPLLPDANSSVVSLYHVLPIPTTFFVDKEGVIRHIQIGPVTREMMEKWLLGP